jgi:ribosomal protein S18 acetylase RimI-like enzyme
MMAARGPLVAQEATQEVPAMRGPTEGPGVIGLKDDPEKQVQTATPHGDTVSILKTPVFGAKGVQDAKYHIEVIQDINGARVTRYWDRDIAYLDLVRFGRHARPDPREWKLGDALERAYHAHLAVSPSSWGEMDPVFNYIHHVEVQVAQRKAGVGSKLVRFVVHDIRSLDRKGWIWLAANATPPHSEEALFRFYERLGFRRLAPGVSLMYFDPFYSRRIKVDPTEAAGNVAYVPQ